jgi:hypothetical protein
VERWWQSTPGDSIDLDLVPDDLDREKVAKILQDIGFKPSKSRYFKHPLCPHHFLEFPRGPVEIGEEFPVVPDPIEIEGRRLRLLSPTDSVKKDHRFKP